MRRIQNVVLATMLMTVGCASPPPQTGSIELSLAASDDTFTVRTLKQHPDAARAIVTIYWIEAHLSGLGWVPVLQTPVEVDLLELEGKSLASLGLVTLYAGKVEKIRLHLDEAKSYVVTKDGTKLPLDVPAGGVVDVVGICELPPCASGVLMVDFNPHLQVRDANGQKGYAVKPVAKIKTVKTSGSCEGDTGRPQGNDGGNGNGNGNGQCGGVACAPGEVCKNGMCVSDPCAGVACAPGEMCVDGTCQPTDPCANVTCAPGETCQGGQCVSAGDMSPPPGQDWTPPPTNPDDKHPCDKKRKQR